MILDRIERRKIDMPALAGLDMVMISVTPDMRDAKPCAGAYNADRAFARQGRLRAAQMIKMFRASLGYGMADRAKVIDQNVPVDTKFFSDQSGADDPWVVGEPDHLAIDGPGNCNCNRTRQGLAGDPSILLPCRLEARMLSRLECGGLTQRDDAPGLDVGEREARMRAANINCDDPSHSPAPASMAEAPCSAPSAPLRIIANSSRPTPS